MPKSIHVPCPLTPKPKKRPGKSNKPELRVSTREIVAPGKSVPPTHHKLMKQPIIAPTDGCALLPGAAAVLKTKSYPKQLARWNDGPRPVDSVRRTGYVGHAQTIDVPYSK